MFSQFANKEYSFSVCKHTNIIDNQTKQTIFFYKQPRATTMMTTTTLGINKKNCKFFVFFSLFSFILPKIMINFFFVSLCVCCCCCCAKDQKKQKIVGRKQQQYFMINDDDRNRIWTTKNINWKSITFSSLSLSLSLAFSLDCQQQQQQQPNWWWPMQKTKQNKKKEKYSGDTFLQFWFDFFCVCLCDACFTVYMLDRNSISTIFTNNQITVKIGPESKKKKIEIEIDDKARQAVKKNPKVMIFFPFSSISFSTEIQANQTPPPTIINWSNFFLFFLLRSFFCFILFNTNTHTEDLFDIMIVFK